MANESFNYTYIQFTMIFLEYTFSMALSSLAELNLLYSYLLYE